MGCVEVGGPTNRQTCSETTPLHPCWITLVAVAGGGNLTIGLGVPASGNEKPRSDAAHDGAYAERGQGVGKLRVKHGRDGKQCQETGQGCLESRGLGSGVPDGAGCRYVT